MQKLLTLNFIITSFTFLHMGASDNEPIAERLTKQLRENGIKVNVIDHHVYTRECDAQASKQRQQRVNDTKTRLRAKLEQRRVAKEGNQ